MGKYIIYNKDTQQFFTSNKEERWSSKFQMSAVFNSPEATENFMEATFRSVFTEELKSSIEIRNHTEMIREIADLCYDKFEDSMKALIEAVGNVEALLSFYHEEVTVQTGIQQDILHKIELDDSMTGIKGIKLMRMLRTVRRERRKAKDNEECLSKFKEMNGLALVLKMKEYFDKRENRVYNPRQCSELFNK